MQCLNKIIRARSSHGPLAQHRQGRKHREGTHTNLTEVWRSRRCFVFVLFFFSPLPTMNFAFGGLQSDLHLHIRARYGLVNLALADGLQAACSMFLFA